jgi:Uma2 family endonuclease
MASAARKLADYRDVLSAPADHIAQVIDGDLVLQPRPRSRHARASSRLGGGLDGPFDQGNGGPGGWIILDEPELHLGPEPQILVPDLAGWRRERMPKVPDVAFFTLAPDWVCEVLSPSTAVLDRGRKSELYAREGVKHLWLFDVQDRFIEAFELENGRWMKLGVFAGDEERIAPFDAVPLSIPKLLADLE